MGPVLFLLYINDLPLGISESNVDIYADDTTLWKTGTDPTSIQHGLQSSLIKADHWFSRRNKPMPNAKKTKQLLFETKQKISHCANPVLNLFLRGTKIKEAVNEKLLGVILDKRLDWTNRINYMITKLKYLPFSLRKLLYNALIKSILEYCFSLWGNATNHNLIRLLRIQKRCARLILDTNVYASSVNLFNKLGWIPIDDIIVLRKLRIMFNIINGKCADHFDHYICYVNTRYNYAWN